jgi:hypothetical protein
MLLSSRFNRHSPYGREFKPKLRLFWGASQFRAAAGPPPSRSRTVLGRPEVNPSVENAEFSVIETHLSRGF